MSEAQEKAIERLAVKMQSEAMNVGVIIPTQEWREKARRLIREFGLVAIDSELVEAVRKAQAAYKKTPPCTCYDQGCPKCLAHEDVINERIVLSDAVLAALEPKP